MCLHIGRRPTRYSSCRDQLGRIRIIIGARCQSTLRERRGDGLVAIHRHRAGVAGAGATSPARERPAFVSHSGQYHHVVQLVWPSFVWSHRAVTNFVSLSKCR